MRDFEVQQDFGRPVLGFEVGLPGFIHASMIHPLCVCVCMCLRICVYIYIYIYIIYIYVIGSSFLIILYSIYIYIYINNMITHTHACTLTQYPRTY